MRAEIECLYMAHAHELRASLRGRGVNPETAEELVQEAFLAVSKKMASERIEEPKLYLWKVASNIARKRYRQEQKRLSRERDARSGSSEISPDMTHAVDDRLALPSVAHALMTLTVRQREAYWYRHAEGRPRSEIAMIMGITVATVDTHLERADNKIAESRERSKPR